MVVMLSAYRETLALRGTKPLLTVAVLARVPIAAGAVTLTLHVVNGLGRGYFAAGAVGAAFTIGGAASGPVLGRIIDRRGLRPVVVLTTAAEVSFWFGAAFAPYPALLVASLIAGFLALPVVVVTRQAIAALVPASHRVSAFALDSIATELSFIAGPSLGVLVCTTAGTRTGMCAVGTGILAAGLGLLRLNPPVRAEGEDLPADRAARVPRRRWLGPSLVAILAVTAAAGLVVNGTSVAVVAALNASDDAAWTGVVLSAWSVYSMLGGFVYGLARRRWMPLLLFVPMAAVTIPLGLGGDHWWLLILLILPAGALYAPTITAAVDGVSRWAPAAVRGEALGWQHGALTAGLAAGTPLAGLLVDRSSATWAFAGIGVTGLLVSLVAFGGRAVRSSLSGDDLGQETFGASGEQMRLLLGGERPSTLGDRSDDVRGFTAGAQQTRARQHEQAPDGVIGVVDGRPLGVGEGGGGPVRPAGREPHVADQGRVELDAPARRGE
nr:MFS transporter [Cryptosporangium phraense]